MRTDKRQVFARNMLLLFVMALLCVACEKNNRAFDMINGDPDDEPHVEINLVKFKDDKYQEYIIGHLSDQGYIHMATYGKVPIAKEFIQGTNPFHKKLPNGYWVINWRWGYPLFYPSNAVLLPYKWETLSDWSLQWEIPDTIIPYNQFVEDYTGITRLAIDEYLKIDYKWGTEMHTFLYWPPRIWYKDLSDFPPEEAERYYACIQQQDSLHALYVQRLTDIINNGGFDELRAK